MDFFSIKICLLNHRKFDIMQEISSEKANKELLQQNELLKQNIFVKLEKFNK